MRERGRQTEGHGREREREDAREVVKQTMTWGKRKWFLDIVGSHDILLAVNSWEEPWFCARSGGGLQPNISQCFFHLFWRNYQFSKHSTYWSPSSQVNAPPLIHTSSVSVYKCTHMDIYLSTISHFLSTHRVFLWLCFIKRLPLFFIFNDPNLFLEFSTAVTLLM